jgi:hypothetical protein
MAAAQYGPQCDVAWFRDWRSVTTRFAVGRIKIDNAMIDRNTAVKTYRTSAVELLFDLVSPPRVLPQLPFFG